MDKKLIIPGMRNIIFHIFLLLIVISASACSAVNSYKYARVGSEYLEVINKQGFWLRALPPPDLTRVGYQKERANKFTEALCNSYVSAMHGKSEQKEPQMNNNDKECFETTEQELEEVFKSIDKNTQIYDPTKETISRLRKHLLVNSYDAFSCVVQPDIALPAALVHAMVSYRKLNDIQLNEAISVINQSKTHLIFDTSHIKTAVSNLSENKQIVVSAYQTLPLLETLATRCAATKIRHSLIGATNSVLSAVEIDPLSVVRFSLQIEKESSLPAAFESKIGELLSRITDTTIRFNNNINLVKTLSHKAEKVDDSRALKALSHQLLLLSELVEFDVNSLVLLSQDQQRLNWQYLEQIAELSNTTRSLSPVMQSTRENTLILTTERLERMQCVARSAHLISSTLDRFYSIAENMSSVDREKLIAAIAHASETLTQKTCSATITPKPCASVKHGKREYFRAATNSIRSAITKQTNELPTLKTTLANGFSFDDWKVARNIITAQILQGIDLGIRAINSESSCIV